MRSNHSTKAQSTARAHRELVLLQREWEREKLKTKPGPYPNTAAWEQEQPMLDNTATCTRLKMFTEISNTLREPKPKDTPANHLDRQVLPTHSTPQRPLIIRNRPAPAARRPGDSSKARKRQANPNNRTDGRHLLL